MDIPPETKETNEPPVTSEKISPKGIAAMQGEMTNAETSPKIEDKQIPEPVKPIEPEPPPDNNSIDGPQVGFGEIGTARKIETGPEMPEKKLFTLTEDEAKKAADKEIYHAHGPEGGF